MEGLHSKTCGECYHWFCFGESLLGECFSHPPEVFKVMKVSVNPLTRQPLQEEGLVSHYPVTRLDNRACGEFKPDLTTVKRKENKS
jgi:hypothetical protein